MKIEFIRPTNPEEKPFRLLEFCGHRVNPKNFLLNGNHTDFRKKLFAVYAPLGNFAHCLCILWSEGEHEVLNDVVDANLLDSLQVEEKDATEGIDSEGFPQDKDQIARLGNASEPFDLTDLSIVKIKASEWQSDWQFCIALGQSMADPQNFETLDDCL